MSKKILNLLKAHNNDYSKLEPFTCDNPIKSSIIIPVYNKRDLFRKTLENLSFHSEINKNPSFFEIIIIDDYSKEDISELISSFKFPCNLNYLKNELNYGPSFSRNKGIKISSNELLFFFDSDIFLPSNYFRETWKVHNSVKKACVVGLTEELSEGDFRIESLNENNLPDITKDFRFYKNTSKYNSLEIKKREYFLIKETDWFKRFGYNKKIGFWTLPYMVVSNNISVKKEYILSIGGFDERMTGWGVDDTFLGAKLISQGCYVIPLKNTGAFVIKHSPRLGTEEDKKFQMLENLKRYHSFIQETLIIQDI
jgi:glycosyltransferase involved in cell wall biosynthesis